MPNQQHPVNSQPDLFGLLFTMAERQGQTLQLAADTKDSVNKIQEIQTKQVTDMVTFQGALAEYFRDHQDLKDQVNKNSASIEQIENRELARTPILDLVVTNTADIKEMKERETERKGMVKVLAFLWSIVGTIAGAIVMNIKDILKFFGVI